MKARLAQEGIKVEDGAGLRQAAAKTDRMTKQYDRDQMRSRHFWTLDIFRAENSNLPERA